MISKRCLLVVATVFAITANYAQISKVSNTGVWQSKLVTYDKASAKLTYNADPVSGEKIADFSVAGYKGGGVALPQVDVKKTIEPVSGDNAKHIQDAIDELGRLPLDANGIRGAVLLKPGIYKVDKTIYINKSGVVLRGSGQGSNPSTSTIIIGSLNIPRTNEAVLQMGGTNDINFRRKITGTESNIIGRNR